MNRVWGAAVVLTLLALGTAWLVRLPEAVRWDSSPGSPCSRLRDLSAVVDMSSPADQAVIRARSVRLAAALQVQLTQDQADGDVGSAELHRVTLGNLTEVLADPTATAADLVKGLQGLASHCGVELDVRRRS